MAPSNTAVVGLLRQAVYYHLDNFSFDNALFFAERLTAQDPRSGESAQLLSLCHYHLGDFLSAYEVGKAGSVRGGSLGSAWIFAQSCLELERYKEGIAALEKSKGLWSQKNTVGKHTASTRAANPDAAAVLCLLGKLYRGLGDVKKAVGCFEEALKANPFMWDAFTSLCDMGVTVRVPSIFRPNDAVVRSFDSDTPAIPESREWPLPTSVAMDPHSRKPFTRSALSHDMHDPFESRRIPSLQDPTGGAHLFSPESEGSDFLGKIAAARSRMAAAQPIAMSSGGLHMSDASDPPSTATPISEPHVARATFAEPPQAPARRSRMQAAQPPPFLELPPRMSERLGAKRTTRSQDKTQEQPSVDSGSDASTAILRSSTSGIDRKRTVSGHAVQQRVGHGEEPTAPQRRSTRLNMFRPSANKANSGAATIGAVASREAKKPRPPISRVITSASGGSSVGRVVSGNRKPIDDSGVDVDHGEGSRIRETGHHTHHAPPKPTESDGAKIEEALKWVLDLLRKLGTGYLALAQYKCHDAVLAFNSLPRTQQDTPWVLGQMGRTLYEQASYGDAEKYFRRLRVLAPTRLEDMEVYSTVLWHLRRETDLSFLAHELIDIGWHSPQAWCALGNAWSLVRDHEQAVRCFRRATQLNPRFSYAFTLQGHEHVANEEYEKALTAYRMALVADRRHYNAYYGIGRVYEKLGNFDKAYTHFEAASSMNPTNAVLLCCIGNVLERQKQIGPALEFFTRAVNLAPKAAQARYKKARALLAMGRLDEAHTELLALKDLAPDEANVHFLLGKLYRSTNDRQLAVRHFSSALALDPKASQKIKEAMIESFEDGLEVDDSMIQ